MFGDNPNLPSLRHHLLSLQPCKRDGLLSLFIKRLPAHRDGEMDPSSIIKNSLTHLEKLLKTSSTFDSVRSYLKTYAATGSETGRYDPFVRAGNAALQSLKNDQISNGLLGECADSLIFWRNDPDEHIHPLKPEPNIPLIRASAIINHFSNKLSWDEIRDILAPQAPQQRQFKFTPKCNDILTCAEFKLARGASYAVQMLSRPAIANVVNLLMSG
ncbi:hypothetical protein B0H17DRAFT_1028413 [Mycena rosella]|uniref:Uncharacterized protein n=1 Tax=Mycena rosella TaxID=1033263 RepID=A0AAD7H159_MYCRO|nr:hypothetical protein B0H17DRAFT_1028413 [Mycena rosella]